MKKKLLSLILSLVLAVSALTVTATGAVIDPDAPEPDPALLTEAPTQALSEDMTEADAAVIRTDKAVDLAEVAAVAYPSVTGVTPQNDGVTIKWTSFTGAAQYYVFIKKPQGGWKIIGKSTTTSFLYRVSPNGTQTYTVRAADKAGKFVSLCDSAGYTFTYLSAPTLASVKNIVNGQTVTWKAVKGASFYRIYVRSDSGWKPVTVTSKTSLTYYALTSGKKYAYTVRCWDKDKKQPLSYFNGGIAATYLTAPKITGFTPAKNGTTLSWKTVKGASLYGVYIKNGSKWKRIGTTAKTSFTHTNPTNNVIYRYTVACVDSKNNLTSAAQQGDTYRYISPPRITSVKDGTVSWNTVPAAAAYRVYRREFGKDWVAVAKSSVSVYSDTSAPRDTVYSYTIRCLDTSGKANSYFYDNNTYYYNGSLADGKITVGASALYFDKGQLRQGFVTVGGKTYYYNAKGVLQKNGLVGSKSEGYRYADKNGVINDSFTGVATDPSGTSWYVTKGKVDRTLRMAVTYGGADYDVIDGVAHKVKTEEERTLFRALKLANRVADRSLPKAKRLKILWDYIKGAYVEKNPRIPHYRGMDWPVIYANDMLINGVGNCMSYGAEFCFLAKAIGYDNVYACHSGGHGWAEIDGLVYDPEWSRHRFQYTYYALSYNTKTDQNYRGAIAPGLPWMHIKICGHL